MFIDVTDAALLYAPCIYKRRPFPFSYSVCLREELQEQGIPLVYLLDCMFKGHFVLDPVDSAVPDKTYVGSRRLLPV